MNLKYILEAPPNNMPTNHPATFKRELHRYVFTRPSLRPTVYYYFHLVDHIYKCGDWDMNMSQSLEEQLSYRDDIPHELNVYMYCKHFHLGSMLQSGKTAGLPEID